MRFLCMALFLAVVLTAAGCAQNTEGETDTAKQQKSGDITILGEGAQSFDFSVSDLDQNVTWFEIHTDETVVGAALSAVGLIEGEEGPFGLYVKTVNGIPADYDKDKTYWAFYVNDEYAVSGVDQTEIKEGDSYSFKIEK